MPQAYDRIIHRNVIHNNWPVWYLRWSWDKLTCGRCACNARWYRLLGTSCIFSQSDQALDLAAVGVEILSLLRIDRSNFWEAYMEEGQYLYLSIHYHQLAWNSIPAYGAGRNSKGVGGGGGGVWEDFNVFFVLPTGVHVTLVTVLYQHMQRWTLTYFETCPFGQVRVIFTCPNWKFTCPHFFVWYSLAVFSVRTTALSIKETSNFTCPVGQVGWEVQSSDRYFQLSRAVGHMILNVHPWHGDRNCNSISSKLLAACCK